MKSLVALSIALSAMSGSIAQESKAEILQVPANIVCTDLTTITKFTQDNGEIPFASMISMLAIGKESQWPGKEVSSVMFVNPKKFSWTIVTKITEGAYCVTASGTYMTPALDQGVANPSADKPESTPEEFDWQKHANLTKLKD